MGLKKNKYWKRGIIQPGPTIRARLLLQPKAIAFEPKIVVNLQVETDIVSAIKKVAHNVKQVRCHAKK
jgi:hypothetical protein